jgi:hypothetical protein
MGHGSRAAERKSLSVYQYCRYPAKWLNHRNLQLPVSRDFRFRLRLPTALLQVLIERASSDARTMPGFRGLL